MKTQLLLFVLIFCVNILFAQETNNEKNMPDLSGYRKVVKFNDPYSTLRPPLLQEAVKVPKSPKKLQYDWNADPKVTKLLSKKLIREASVQAIEGEGWRIQIFSGNQQQANSTRFDFLEEFPKQSVYSMYEKPFFKIRVGDFRTKREADEFCNQIKTRFPMSFVLPDKIVDKK